MSNEGEKFFNEIDRRLGINRDEEGRSYECDDEL
jgi:hypothetical protein